MGVTRASLSCSYPSSIYDSEPDSSLLPFFFSFPHPLISSSTDEHFSSSLPPPPPSSHSSSLVLSPPSSSSSCFHWLLFLASAVDGGKSQIALGKKREREVTLVPTVHVSRKSSKSSRCVCVCVCWLMPRLLVRSVMPHLKRLDRSGFPLRRCCWIFFVVVGGFSPSLKGLLMRTGGGGCRSVNLLPVHTRGTVVANG